MTQLYRLRLHVFVYRCYKRMCDMDVYRVIQRFMLNILVIYMYPQIMQLVRVNWSLLMVGQSGRQTGCW